MIVVETCYGASLHFLPLCKLKQFKRQMTISIGILFEIILMIIFGGVEILQRHNLDGDFT